MLSLFKTQTIVYIKVLLFDINLLHDLRDLRTVGIVGFHRRDLVDHILTLDHLAKACILSVKVRSVHMHYKELRGSGVGHLRARHGDDAALMGEGIDHAVVVEFTLDGLVRAHNRQIQIRSDVNISAFRGSCEVVEEAINYLNAKGEKLGMIKVRLYRPWSSAHFLAAIPATAKKIAVLDRTKEPGSQGEPLYQDVVMALAKAGKNDVTVIGGRYGLGSKDTTPASFFAVYEELAKEESKEEFTLGIVDDVTYLSLDEKVSPNTAAEGTIECKFWGLGGDGTVGANKNSIKIIGDHTDKYVQAYFQYDSKKTGGVTVSHLRFGDKPIKSPYYINKADFVACHNPSYITKGFKIVQDVKPGGVFLINCQWTLEELEHHLDAASKRYIAENNIQLYTINAIDLAIKVGMGKRTNTILQSAFFSLAKVMPQEEAIGYMKDAATKSYSKKGMDIVEMNHKAIDAGATAFKKIEVPADWANAVDAPKQSTLTGPAKLLKLVEGDTELLTALGLHFLYENDGISSVIVGTKKPANVAKNVELLKRDLPEGLLEKAKAAVSE